MLEFSQVNCWPGSMDYGGGRKEKRQKDEEKVSMRGWTETDRRKGKKNRSTKYAVECNEENWTTQEGKGIRKNYQKVWCHYQTTVYTGKRTERTILCTLKSHNRALQVSGSILQTGLCTLKWPYCCCTATNTGAWTGFDFWCLEFKLRRN